MNFTIDFEGAIARALDPEKLTPILDKHLMAAITSAIQDATGYSSEFQRALRSQLSEALPHGLRNDDLVKFQHVLNQAMTALVGEANRATVAAAMTKAVSVVMPDVPAVLKLSKFMEGAREGLHKEEREPFYAFMKVSDYGTTYICIDSDVRPGSSHRHADRESMQYSAKYRLSVSKEGEVYALYMNGKHVTPGSLPNVVGQFDASLMAMYVGRTKLEIDMDDDDLESLSSEQEFD